MWPSISIESNMSLEWLPFVSNHNHFLGYDGIQYNFLLFLNIHKRQLITRFLQLNNSTLKNVMMHSPDMNISSSAKWYSSAPLNLSTTATLGVDRRKGLLWHRQVAIMGREGCFLFYFFQEYNMFIVPSSSSSSCLMVIQSSILFAVMWYPVAHQTPVQQWAK